VNPADGSANAVAIQGSSAPPSRRSRPIAGSATFRIEKSIDSMNCDPSSSVRISFCLVVTATTVPPGAPLTQAPAIRTTDRVR
jgi:hypothetical protein